MDNFSCKIPTAANLAIYFHKCFPGCHDPLIFCEAAAKKACDIFESGWNFSSSSSCVQEAVQIHRSYLESNHQSSTGMHWDFYPTMCITVELTAAKPTKKLGVYLVGLSPRNHPRANLRFKFWPRDSEESLGRSLSWNGWLTYNRLSYE